MTASLIPVTLAFLGIAMPAGADQTVLTLTDAMRDAAVMLTRAGLKALPQATLVTAISVTDGTLQFEGFLRCDLSAEHDATGDRVIALALNDFRLQVLVSVETWPGKGAAFTLLLPVAHDEGNTANERGAADLVCRG